MNAFLIAATILLAMLVLPGIVIVRPPAPIHAIVALELAGTTVTLVLLCLAEGYHRSVYFNVPLVAALCVWVSGLVFVRFVGRLR